MKALPKVILSFCLTMAFTIKAFSDQKVQDMGDSFLINLPSDWNSSVGTWEYFDLVKCFTTPGMTCYGNNPTSPYGQPSFVDPSTNLSSTVFQMRDDEAVVIILRTPPPMRYYSFVQYLFQRPGASSPVFASLSDAINFKKLGTTDNVQSGSGAFDSYSALVWTANTNTYDTVKQKLLLSGLPEQAINFYPLPTTLPTSPVVNLQMGYGDQSEKFSMLMRTAMPVVPANFKDYMNEKPFYVLRVGPATQGVRSPASVLGYASEISGKVEASNLQTSLNRLVNDIQSNYGATYNFKKQSIAYTSKVGWDCIAGTDTCAGDNHDALYSQDLERPLIVKSIDDFVIVAGINHQKTGKATYINHAIYDTKKFAGIASVNDTALTTSSALYHAGVTGSKDVRQITYQNLYAYIISYNCTGRQYCLQIPAPTPDNPVGLAPGSPFFVMGRSYLEPTTLVRPSDTEIIHHQVFIGTKK